MLQLPLDLAQPPPPTLDNFAPGPNAQVMALLHEWQRGSLATHCLYLWGPHGTGKSHLLRAVVDADIRQGRPARYLAPGMGLARELAAGMQLLAIDGVSELSEASQGALFSLLNQAAESQLRLLLAGDNAPSGLRLRPDASTRISQGLVLQLRLLSDEDKQAALRQHARGRGFELSSEAADYLLRHGQRDLPTLMRVLDAADRYSLQTQRAVTIPLLREVLQQCGGDRAAHLPAM